MRATKSLRYLCLIFTLFIDILIYLKVLKNTLSLMEVNTGEDIAEKIKVKYLKSNYFIS